MRPEIGEQAPSLAGRTLAGDSFDLAQLRGRPVVIEFFRGTWWTNCRKRLGQVREVRGELEALGATIIGVVCQRRTNVERHFAKEPPPLPLLIDEDRSLAKRWGVYHRLGIDAIHIAHPATIVIDAGGRIRFFEIAPNQYDRVPFSKVLEVLRSLAHG